MYKLQPEIYEQIRVRDFVMNGFLTRFTFGFIMAQFFPGAVVILSLTTSYLSTFSKRDVGSLKDLFFFSFDKWFSSNTRIIIFVFLAIGFGMLIHGIHWTVLAWLENHKGGKTISSRESFWHNYYIIFQLFLSPFKMIIELLWVLFAPSVDRLTTEENIPQIAPEYMEHYHSLEAFYLNFGQFFSHVSYAILISFICVVYNCLSSNVPSIYFIILPVLYFATSTFFIIGRIQLGSLFKAERELVVKSTQYHQRQTRWGC